MARVPYLDDTQAPELKPLADRIRAQRGGRLLNLYRALLNSPGVADAWLQYFTVIRQRCDLPARDRELVILIIALINDAEYEYRGHIPFALQAGLTQAQLDELPHWRDSAAFSDRDRAVLAMAESMTRDVKVPDEVFAQVQQHFAPRQLVELAATIAGYNMVSRVLEALRIDHEAD
jgi:alkylhydroperoxidase family enzyme